MYGYDFGSCLVIWSFTKSYRTWPVRVDLATTLSWLEIFWMLTSRENTGLSPNLISGELLLPQQGARGRREFLLSKREGKP